MFFVTKLLTSFVGLFPSLALACNMGRSLAETHFVLDPSSEKTSMQSVRNNSQIILDRCAPETKYVLVNLNSIYFEGDTARQESISGNLLQKKSNCSIRSEIPFKKVETDVLAALVRQKNDFLKKCIKLVIADGRGQKLKIHNQSQCQFKPIEADGTVYETNGLGCLIELGPNARLLMETRVNPDCLKSEFLSSNSLAPGDYESVIKLWPAILDKGTVTVGSPFGARYLRHTLLPAKNFMPRAQVEDENHAPFISALATNIHPGSVIFMSLGKNKVLFSPTFLVENITKDYCKDSLCAKVSSFVSPIAGMMTLNRINKKTGRKNQIGEWPHAIKVPGNWSGLAELKVENNLTGLAMGTLEADMTLNPNDEFEFQSKFYEPRSFLDEVLSQQEYMILNNNLNIFKEFDEALPELPNVGKLGKLRNLPRLPLVGLGMRGVIDFMDQFNMTRSWTQKYDRLCNSENKNCIQLKGYNNPFIIITMRFRIGSNNEIIPISVEKKSSVFENYNQKVTQFASKVCE
jgi:hypothetical protein